MADNRKVRFGLKNVHYAKRTVTNGEATYATPVAIPGAVSLDLSPAGEDATFYADNIDYYHTWSNQGYTGSIEVAKIPTAMLKDIWGMTEDASGNITEKASVEPSGFALIYQIDGDANNAYHALYNVTAGRPNIGSATIEATKTPQTQTIDLTALPDEDDNVHTYGVPSDSQTITAWFTAL